MITSNNLIPVTISEKFPFSPSKEKQHPSKIRNTRKKKTVSDSANCKRTSLLSYKMRYQKGKKKENKNTNLCGPEMCANKFFLSKV